MNFLNFCRATSDQLRPRSKTSLSKSVEQPCSMRSTKQAGGREKEIEVQERWFEGLEQSIQQTRKNTDVRELIFYILRELVGGGRRDLIDKQLRRPLPQK